MLKGTKTARVLAMRSDGLTTRQIAEHLGIKPNNVTALEFSAGRGQRDLATGRLLPRVGKRAAGDLLDGVQHHEFPRMP